MKIICLTTTAIALSSAPAIAGVCPDAFLTTLRTAMVQRAMDEAEGTLAVIAADGSTFSILKADDHYAKYSVDDKTVYTLDGKEVERDVALAVGRHAKVTYEKDLASRVDVMSEK